MMMTLDDDDDDDDGENLSACVRSFVSACIRTFICSDVYICSTWIYLYLNVLHGMLLCMHVYVYFILIKLTPSD